MRSYNHIETFAGYPVVTWHDNMEQTHDPAKTIFAIRVMWDDKAGTWLDRFSKLLQVPNIEQTPGFIIGAWNFESGGIDEVVNTVAANRDKLPNLKALFVGEISADEQEISWIAQGDLSALILAYPKLETLVIRGGDGLRLGNIKHDSLKYLRIETGAMPREAVRSVAEAQLPALETCILWLGTTDYGANYTMDDLQGFYNGDGKPNMTYLGLCNAHNADDVAQFIAPAPVLKQLHTLDMSMGAMTDIGALALIKSPLLSHLKHLNLRHHFITEATMAQLLKVAGEHNITVNLDDAQDEEEGWRFVEVSE